MANISTWSTTAANNNATPPDGFPEGQTPSSVNNAARELMAAIRRQHEDAQWIDLGLTHTRTGSDTFTIAGDYTSTYEAGRRVKMTGSATNYGTISASSYSAPDTTVTISEGNVPAALAAIAVGILTNTDSALPGTPSGSFTGTLTGVTGTVTGTVKYVVSNRVVTMWIESTILGTSNATTMTLTGIPSAIQPSTRRRVMCELTDSAGSVLGYCQLDTSSGTATFAIAYDDAGPLSASISFNSNGFTNSASKGLALGWTISYPL